MEQLKQEIFKLQVAGMRPKQIWEKLGLTERTYYNYCERLTEDIVAEQSTKRREEILVEKEKCRARIEMAMQGHFSIANDMKQSGRTRMDSWTRYVEDSVGLLKIEAETTNWLLAHNQLHLDDGIKRYVELNPESEESTPTE